MYLCKNYHAQEMDIDLFSDIVKNLIVDNDEVALPGLGTFVSELMPSSFSDKGYTINPPYRRLSFRQRWNEEDTLLAGFYSKTNGTSLEASQKIMSDFLKGLKETLQTKKAVLLPGLGRLRATKENTFFFIADEDLDIYPYGFGLEPVSLKTHEETPVETVEEAPVETHKGKPAETIPVVSKEEIAVATVPSKDDPKASEETEPVNEGQPKMRWNYFAIILFVVGILLLLLIVFTVVARLNPGIFDSILYSPEELQIINYPLS